MVTPNNNIALEIDHVSKAFPGVQALDKVSLNLYPGEIHALIGENGAGKSTLIKIVTGLYHQDEGELRIFGEKVDFNSTYDAIQKGISVVPQERNLIPAFTVGENILLEKIPTKSSVFVDYNQIHKEAQKWLDIIGLDIDEGTLVSNLSAAHMQLVETAKALALESRVLLLDEPTASITPHEVVFLFDVLRGLRERGVAILFVTHKLEEVFELCDRVTVLRDGKNVASGEPLENVDRSRLVYWMIGRKQIISELPEKQPRSEEPILEAKGLSSSGGPKNINIELYKGEILGIYGLIGAGRTELAHTLIGAMRKTEGEIYVQGEPANIKNVTTALNRYKIGYVSENRKEEGLILSTSVAFNISIAIWKRIAKFLGWISPKEEMSIVEKYVKELDIKTPSLNQVVLNLSGGNQQKVSIAKWLAAHVDILIFDEPTVGIDVKTKDAIHDLIWDLSARGEAIMLISSDMPEMIRLADRILVMKENQIVSELENTRNYDEMSEAIMTVLA